MSKKNVREGLCALSFIAVAYIPKTFAKNSINPFTFKKHCDIIFKHYADFSVCG